MPHVCAAPSCAKAPARADTYCPAHRTRFKRYGHPLQDVVSARDLEPFACRIASRLPDDGGGEVRALLADRWSKLVTVVETIRTSGIHHVPFGAPSADRPATSAQREAARRFLITATSTNSREVADIVIGLAMLRAVKPEAFKDATSFRFMITRRFLGLSTANATRDRRSGSTTYRTFPPGLMLAVAEWLWSAFGEVAEKMAEVELVEMEKVKADEERLRSALAGVGQTTA